MYLVVFNNQNAEVIFTQVVIHDLCWGALVVIITEKKDRVKMGVRGF